MIKNISYELPISPNYVINWGVKEAIRELLQNAIDEDKVGHSKEIEYDQDSQNLRITNIGSRLHSSSLVLGCSHKQDVEGLVGKFGEGYKLALVVLLREGFTVRIFNQNELWVPCFKTSKQFGTQVLSIDIEECENNSGVTFEIEGIDLNLYNTLLEYFPCINDDYGKVVSSDNGDILLDKKFKGKMFVEGLYIQSDDNFKYGYNFSADVVDLDRDRKAINYYELRKLTAASVITAEECSPELFRAISASYTDIRDITEVLDEASNEFLEEYREMLYEEKDLEQDTLVATKSVMKQLEQMDIDVPIVEGTEIESYLIAKANDKLGLIFEAEEEVNNRESSLDAYDHLADSTYAKLLHWLYNNKEVLSEEACDEFYNILSSITPYMFYKIKDYIPEDFDYSRDSILSLKDNFENTDELNEI